MKDLIPDNMHNMSDFKFFGIAFRIHGTTNIERKIEFSKI